MGKSKGSSGLKIVKIPKKSKAYYLPEVIIDDITDIAKELKVSENHVFIAIYNFYKENSEK